MSDEAPRQLRDAKGRFRKPTDEERWPNPSERERLQRIRGYFDLCKPAMMELLQHAKRDMDFCAGTIWRQG